MLVATNASRKFLSSSRFYHLDLSDKLLSLCTGTVYCTKPFIKNFNFIAFLGMVTPAFNHIQRHRQPTRVELATFRRT